MFHTLKTSFYLLAGLGAALFLMSGCDSLDTEAQAQKLATMQTFHMGDVQGALSNFTSRDMQDVIVLTQEMIARELEAKGYVEVPRSDPADFLVVPSWTFYSERSNMRITQSETVYDDPTMTFVNGTTNARMNIDFIDINGGGQIWSTSANWGIRTDINTTSDFVSSAQMALAPLPVCQVSSHQTGAMPTMPKTGVQATPETAPEPTPPTPAPGTPSN